MRGKNWEFLMYPDTMPANWKEIIESWRIPVAVSPLHDKDISKEDPTRLAKPHYHVLVMYNNTTTLKQIQSITKELGVEYIKPAISVRGSYDYWIHKNNPEKYQYKDSDRTNFLFESIEEVAGLTESEIDQIKKAIVSIIENNNIYEYYDLINYLRDKELDQCLKIASQTTMFFNSYLKSKKGKLEKTEEYKKQMGELAKATIRAEAIREYKKTIS